MNTYRLKVIVFLILSAFFLGACAGGTLQTKTAIGGPDDVYVYDEKTEVVLHLNDWAGGEILGKTKKPAAFDEIPFVVAQSLKSELGKKNIFTSREDQIPSKTTNQGLDEVTVPDWSKRDYKTLISTSVTLSYFAKPASEGMPPYTYKLRGKTTIRVVRNEGGKLKLLMPTDSGSLDIALIEKDLKLSTGQVAGIESLMKAFPSETILPELKERTRQGMGRFIKDMND